jgi:ribonuclease T2
VERGDDGDERQTGSAIWDSVIFTVQWPITTCLKWKESPPSSNHTCLLPDKHRWTIHGVWPTKAGTEGPFFCNRTWPFDSNKVEALKPQLTRLWPNIHAGDTVDSLWKHEWEKHGTCAAIHPSFATEQLYFSQGINWAKNYHMGTILNAAQISPTMSSSYNSTKIWQVIRDALGYDISIACDSDKETGATYLSEIRMCFGKNLRLIDCTLQHLSNTPSFRVHSKAKSAFHSMSLTNCPVHKLISYPGQVPLTAKHRPTKNFKKIVRGLRP